MELIRGRTLEDELKTRGAFSAEEARLIGLDLCRALAAVHEAGLVHRDVKTQNVMREQGGRIVLMDFGAGIATEAGVQRDVAGTPMYLAPEVYAGHQASRVSDIYSLGVLLYHLVTGVYPVSGRNRSAIAEAHSEGRIKRLRDARPDLPGAVRARCGSRARLRRSRPLPDGGRSGTCAAQSERPRAHSPQSALAKMAIRIRGGARSRRRRRSDSDLLEEATARLLDTGRARSGLSRSTVTSRCQLYRRGYVLQVLDWAAGSAGSGRSRHSRRRAGLPD